MLAFDIRAFDTIDSTNTWVKEAIGQDGAEGLVCRAAVQTGGYGRQGRSWESPRGGLYQSLLLRPENAGVTVSQLPSLGLVVALAVREALMDRVSGFDCQVKWPNDVVNAAGKVAGISCEVHAGAVCVGMGVNVVAPMDADAACGADAGADDGDTAGTSDAGSFEASYAGRWPIAYAYPAGCADMQDAPDELIDALGDGILAAFAARYDTWLACGFAPFADEFNGCASLAGKHVRIQDAYGGELAAGTVRAVDGLGRLLVEQADGTVRAVASGEAHVQQGESAPSAAAC